MPLDLHVLSLSLAFILSQDQTLRCSNCFFILSRSESKYILFLYFRILTVLFFLVLHLVLHVNLTKIAFYFCVPLEHFQRITLFLFLSDYRIGNGLQR